MAKQIERSRHGHGTGPGRGRLLARAVLPFKHSGVHADLTALAQGLIEEIITGLSRFSYLRVIARSSTSRYGNESVAVRSAGKELGAR